MPLLAVLPGTGGLTRVTDKRKVRRDLADVFCSTEEGVRGKKAMEWRLVDEAVANSRWQETIAARAREIAARSDRPRDASGIILKPLQRQFANGGIEYSHVALEIDRDRAIATLTMRAPSGTVPESQEEVRHLGADFWPLALARELEDCILHLRVNEPQIGIVLFRTEGDAQAVLAHDALLGGADGDWLLRE